MACHIVAAADGPAARRTNSDWSDEQLSDISNGVWMCYRHGKLIDADECKYTVGMLRKWRDIANLRALLVHERGTVEGIEELIFEDLKLPKYQEDIVPGVHLNEVIGEALLATCITEVWGKAVADASRDLLFEVASNAFQHGAATRIRLEINPTSIALIDNGCKFDGFSLTQVENARGGADAVNEVFLKFGDRLYLNHSHGDSGNVHTLALVGSSEDIRALTPCVIEANDFLDDSSAAVSICTSCDTVYVLFHRYLSFSDAYKLPGLVAQKLPPNKQYIFVGSRISDGVRNKIAEVLPGVRVMQLE